MIVAVPIERVERFARLVQGNVTARNWCGKSFGRDELRQYASGAGGWILPTIEIHARRRILEREAGSPSLERRPGITPLFEVRKLKFQDTEEVAVVVGHFPPRKTPNLMIHIESKCSEPHHVVA